MSILIDELEARKKDYVVVADVINAMAEATNSAPDEVVKYLNANDVDEHLTVFYMGENYNFYQYNGFLVNVGNDANTTYFRMSDVMTFEPITKHGIFKESKTASITYRDVYGRTIDIHQCEKNREDDYLTLNETINLIDSKTNPDNKPELFLDNTKLRDLARKKKLTPCFYYHGYVGEIDYHGALHTEIIAAYFTYRLLTEEICGYSEFMKLPNEGVGIYRIIERKSVEFTDFDDGLFLFDKDPSSNNFEEARLTYIENDEIRFSKQEVDSYIASFIKKNMSQDITLENKDSELVTNVEKLKSENNDLNSRLIIARATYKQNQNEIKELKAQLEKANADSTELKEQLNKANAALDDIPADNIKLNNLATYNANKLYMISTSQALASYIWSMDTEKAVRTGDMVQQVRHVMHKVAPELLPDDKAIREWLSGIAPDYAKKGGKPPKNTPDEISLIMKK